MTDASGFPEAIEAVYPAAQIQTCIVHLIRNSLNLASWKDRKPLAAAIKPIYQAATSEAAAAALEAFAQSEWGRKFPTVAAMWQRQWEQVIPFFAYPPEVRRIVYTTNANESMHMQLRKIVKNRGHFPSDEAAYYLAASSQSVRHSVRRAIHRRHQLRFLNRPQHTKFLTRPSNIVAPHSTKFSVRLRAANRTADRSINLNC